MRLAAIALALALGGSGGFILRATKAVTPGQLRLAASVEVARLAKLDPRHKAVVEPKGRNELVVTSALPPGAESVLTPPGAFRIYDLEGDLKPPSIDAKGFPKPSAGRLAALPGTTILVCGPPALVCLGLNQYPPKRDVYYRIADLPALTGNDLVRSGTVADSDPATKETIVLVQVTVHGRARFKQVTGVLARRGLKRGTPQHLAFVLDGRILSFPAIDYSVNPNGIYPTNGFEIAGLHDSDRAKQLAAVLGGGALPVPFAVVG